MKEVTWSPGGPSAFYYKKKNTARGNLPVEALLWHSTPIVGEREKKRKTVILFRCDCCLLTRAKKNASVRKT